MEVDAVTELVNLGVSRAAVALREMVREQVLLSVPEVKLVSREKAIKILDGGESRNLVAIHQVFEGDITGRALLIFPEDSSLDLVRAVVGGALPLEDLVELEQEALAEIGNVILNGCLATMANILQRSLRMSLPEVLHGNCVMLFNLEPPPEASDIVLLLFIAFAVRQRNITGHIAMMMDLPSLAQLQVLLNEFIERVTGAKPDAQT